MITDGRYLAAKTVTDVWICYPWEATYVFLATCPTPHTQTASFISLDPATSQAYILIPLTSSRDIDEHDKLAATQTVNY